MKRIKLITFWLVVCLVFILGSMGGVVLSKYFLSKVQTDKTQNAELVTSLVLYFNENASPFYSSFLDAVEAKHGRKIRKLVEKELNIDINKHQNDRLLKFVSEMP